jgi:demethoxyubiquinone hydroxylase (CLK1/Coq7/Cat5 family)
MQGHAPAELGLIATIEERLAKQLTQACKEVEHMDCFDNEQRAEIYTILKALRDDSAAHREMLGQWISDRPRMTN